MDPSTFQDLKVEDDYATITVNGQSIEVEQATFTGTNGDDNITGTSGDDTISPLRGQDNVDGGDGNDLLIIDYSSNTFTGSSNYTAGITSGFNYFRAFYDSNGNSDYISFDGIEHLSITGTSANDAIQTGNGDDLLTGVNPNSLTPGRGEVDTLSLS